jgi:hypothetical protein
VTIHICVVNLFYHEFGSHLVASFTISVMIQDHLAPINIFSRNLLAFFLSCYTSIKV